MRPSEIHNLGIEELQALLKSNKRKGRRKAIMRFLSSFDIAAKITELVLKHTKNKAVLQQATRNQIVNAISAFEVFLKEIIAENGDLWEAKGIASLLSEKVTLGKAYEIISEAKISQLELIVHFSSFNSIESIDAVFTKLKGVDFLKTIKNDENIKEEMIRNVVRAFSVRNKIVHEQSFELHKDDLTSVNAVIQFAISIHIYLNWGTHLIIKNSAKKLGSPSSRNQKPVKQ